MSAFTEWNHQISDDIEAFINHPLRVYLGKIDESYTDILNKLYTTGCMYENITDTKQFSTLREDFIIKPKNEFDEIVVNLNQHRNLKFIKYLKLKQILHLLQLKKKPELPLNVYIYEITNDIQYKSLLKLILKYLDRVKNPQYHISVLRGATSQRDMKIFFMLENESKIKIAEKVKLSPSYVTNIANKFSNQIKNLSNKMQLMLYFNYYTVKTAGISQEYFAKCLEINDPLEIRIFSEMLKLEKDLYYLKELNLYVSNVIYIEVIKKINFNNKEIEVKTITNLIQNATNPATEKIIRDLLISNGYFKRRGAYVKKSL